MIEVFQNRGKARGKVKMPAYLTMAICFIWLFTALFADQLANELPLTCKIDGQRHFPAFRETLSKVSGQSSPRIYYLGKKEEMESVVRAPIPYSPQTIDRANAGYISPLGPQNISSQRYRHWLGTDGMGRDVLAGLIHGSRVALIIGLLSVLAAMLVGVLFGAAAGFFGDQSWRLNILEIAGGTIILTVGLYLLYLQLDCGGSWLYLSGWLLASTALVYLWSSTVKTSMRAALLRLGLSGTMGIPLDLILLRLIEIFRAVPSLFILLALLAIIESPGILQMSLIISLLMWPAFARYTRAEFLSLREQEFVQAAQLLRRSKNYIIFREIMPLAIPPIAVAAAFGVSSAILAESTLSFLGIGFSVEQVSWGSMLNEARLYFRAWWLAVFPGIAIFAVILSMNSLGDYISRQKSTGIKMVD
ncbi:MAG: ABC transporter permease [Saprospirales bacterium]|nr:MAG: ABC transporter permease [Saprospirales bacterium]